MQHLFNFSVHYRIVIKTIKNEAIIKVFIFSLFSQFQILLSVKIQS